MHRVLESLRRFSTICALGLLVMAVWPPVAVAKPGALVAPTVQVPGFTLQVASFAQRSEADAVVSRLQGAWVEKVHQDGRPLFRVNYGRFDERAQAVSAQWGLEDMGYKSFIRQLFA